MAKILAIDDDPAILELLRIRLTAAGHQVFCAGDGYAAASMLAQCKPDLITLDYQMPAGDGSTVLRNIRSNAHTARVPVVFITGAQPPDLEYLKSRDPNAHSMTKPIDMAALSALIARLAGPAPAPAQAAEPPPPPHAPLPPMASRDEDEPPRGETIDLDLDA